MKSLQDYEACKRAGSAIARQVSAVLRKAGLVKAGRYTYMGYRPNGYICGETGNGTNEVPRAWVGTTAGGDRTKVADMDKIQAILAADKRFVLDRRPTTLYVTRSK